MFRLTEPKVLIPSEFVMPCVNGPRFSGLSRTWRRRFSRCSFQTTPPLVISGTCATPGKPRHSPDADVDADEAWDGSQSYGLAPGVRIAIVDDWG